MKLALLFLNLALLLVACSDGGGDPAKTVEQYLQAKVESNDEEIRRLLCSKMEAEFERETRTFETVSGVSIEGMACQREGESDVVRCDGKIVALYGAEETEFPLVSYRVVLEDDEWRWCGEAP